MNPRMRLRTLSGLLLLAASAPALAQQPDKVNLRGIVVDQSTDAPIRAATVGLAGKKWVVVTDTAGRFILPNVELGNANIVVEQLGYADFEQTVEVTADPTFVRVRLRPNPVLLKAIEVMGDRFRARRNAIAFSVSAYNAEQLAMSPAFDVVEFLRARMPFAPCPGRSSSLCVFRRGRMVEPRVYVDDAFWIGGMDVLYGWGTNDIYLVEVIQRGAQVRVYTKRFASLVAQGKAQLSPVMIW